MGKRQQIIFVGLLTAVLSLTLSQRERELTL
jgi:hypothetical protein